MLKRLMPVVLLLAGLAFFFAFDLGRFVSLDALARNRLNLLHWVGSHALLAPLAYVSLYTVVVAFSLPVATVMTLTGGFLFGTIFGALYAVAGATLGATLLFMVAKSSLGDFLLAKAGDSVKRMQQGFADNALSYLLVLRLVPVFPFFLVNLAPAFLGVPLRIFLPATFFGIMPGGFVYALAGSGIGGVLDRGGELALSGILTPQIVGAFVGLAVLALLPVFYKRMHRPATEAAHD